MPTYEYICGACGQRFEARCAISERDRVQRCPHCGAEAGRRQFTACAVRGGARSDGAGGGSGGCASCGSKNCSSCR